jgi:hypothetical protein
MRPILILCVIQTVIAICTNVFGRMPDSVVVPIVLSLIITWQHSMIILDSDCGKSFPLVLHSKDLTASCGYDDCKDPLSPRSRVVNDQPTLALAVYLFGYPVHPPHRG